MRCTLRVYDDVEFIFALAAAAGLRDYPTRRYVLRALVCVCVSMCVRKSWLSVCVSARLRRRRRDIQAEEWSNYIHSNAADDDDADGDFVHKHTLTLFYTDADGGVGYATLRMATRNGQQATIHHISDVVVGRLAACRLHQKTFAIACACVVIYCAGFTIATCAR